MTTCIGEHGEPVAKRMRLAGVGVVLLLVAGTTLGAQDWPHFLGPERDGHYSGPPLDRDWPGGAPRELWRRPVGEGFAGPVVSGGRLLLFHRLRGREVLEALDAETGDSIWRYDYPSNYRDDFGFDEGPRSAPVVAGDRVYTFGAQGQLHAVDLETGNGVWRVDTRARFRFRKAFFGAAGSPLVEDGRVIANVGGAGRMPASWPSMPTPATCSGPWPARKRATRRRWRRPSTASGTRSSSRATTS